LQLNRKAVEELLAIGGESMKEIYVPWLYSGRARGDRSGGVVELKGGLPTTKCAVELKEACLEGCQHTRAMVASP